jgi:heme/copper-type cytochrome/quinol oxidase subunit 2
MKLQCDRSCFGLMLLCSGVSLFAGCALLLAPPPNADADALATYNNQVTQIVIAAFSLVGTILGFVAMWFKSNRVQKELEAKTELMAKELALQTERANAAIAEKAMARNQAVLDEVKTVKDVVVEATTRAPHRATDANNGVVDVRIAKGPGVEESLKVDQTK